MSKTKNLNDSWGEPHFPTMDLRDWFAGQCVSVMIPDCHLDESTFKSKAELSYDMADAMLKARKINNGVSNEG